VRKRMKRLLVEEEERSGPGISMSVTERLEERREEI
jgi:hypothetical protein